MITRKLLPFIFCGLAGLSWPIALTAFQIGVLTVKVTVEPERIQPGGKTQITIVANDGFQKPIGAASIKISTETGYFEASNQNTVFGFTDKDGLFKAVWQSNLRTNPGPQIFEVAANKNAYISKAPITAIAKVIVEGPGQEEGLMRREEDLLRGE